MFFLVFSHCLFLAYLVSVLTSIAMLSNRRSDFEAGFHFHDMYSSASALSTRNSSSLTNVLMNVFRNLEAELFMDVVAVAAVVVLVVVLAAAPVAGCLLVVVVAAFSFDQCREFYRFRRRVAIIAIVRSEIAFVHVTEKLLDSSISNRFPEE